MGQTPRELCADVVFFTERVGDCTRRARHTCITMLLDRIVQSIKYHLYKSCVYREIELQILQKYQALFFLEESFPKSRALVWPMNRITLITIYIIIFV